MTQARQRIGRRAEEIVAAGLSKKGWRILERNARTRYGELDIVALDGGCLVFVEVKASRAGTSFGPVRPVHAVDFKKQRRVRRLSAAWMRENGAIPRYAEIRFDAVGVTFDRMDQVADLEHIENAF